MWDILAQAFGFVAIIILGYVLKKIGFFKEADFDVLSKITIRITLPGAIISSFSEQKFDPAMLSILLLGLGGGLVYILAAFLMNLRSANEKKAFDILNLPGYNIGCFTMPFVRGFLGPVGVITTSIFDTGNAIVCLGGSFGIASGIKDGSKFSLKRLGKALLTSVPFLCYILMATLNLANITLPAPILSCARTIGNANAFVAMLTIGVGFKLSGDRSQMGYIIKMVLVRFSIAGILASAAYFLLPFSQEIRQALVILFFSPIGAAVPPFTRELGGDVGLSSALNSICIVCSIVIIVTLLTVML